MPNSAGAVSPTSPDHKLRESARVEASAGTKRKGGSPITTPTHQGPSDSNLGTSNTSKTPVAETPTVHNLNLGSTAIFHSPDGGETTAVDLPGSHVSVAVKIGHGHAAARTRATRKKGKPHQPQLSVIPLTEAFDILSTNPSENRRQDDSSISPTQKPSNSSISTTGQNLQTEQLRGTRQESLPTTSGSSQSEISPILHFIRPDNRPNFGLLTVPKGWYSSQAEGNKQSRNSQNDKTGGGSRGDSSSGESRKGSTSGDNEEDSSSGGSQKGITNRESQVGSSSERSPKDKPSGNIKEASTKSDSQAENSSTTPIYHHPDGLDLIPSRSLERNITAGPGQYSLPPLSAPHAEALGCDPLINVPPSGSEGKGKEREGTNTRGDTARGARTRGARTRAGRTRAGNTRGGKAKDIGVAQANPTSHLNADLTNLCRGGYRTRAGRTRAGITRGGGSRGVYQPQGRRLSILEPDVSLIQTRGVIRTSVSKIDPQKAAESDSRGA